MQEGPSLPCPFISLSSDHKFWEEIVCHLLPPHQIFCALVEMRPVVRTGFNHHSLCVLIGWAQVSSLSLALEEVWAGQDPPTAAWVGVCKSPIGPFPQAQAFQQQSISILTHRKPVSILKSLKAEE